MTSYCVLVWRGRCQVWIGFLTVAALKSCGQFDPVIRTTSSNADFCEIDWKP